MANMPRTQPRRFTILYSSSAVASCRQRSCCNQQYSQWVMFAPPSPVHPPSDGRMITARPISDLTRSRPVTWAASQLHSFAPSSQLGPSPSPIVMSSSGGWRGMTPLMDACADGDLGRVSSLLRSSNDKAKLVFSLSSTKHPFGITPGTHPLRSRVCRI